MKFFSIRKYLFQYFDQTWHFCTISKSTRVQERKRYNGALVKIKHHKATQMELCEIFTCSRGERSIRRFLHEEKKSVPEAEAGKEKNEKNCRYRRHIGRSRTARNASRVYLTRVSRAFVRVSFRMVEKWYAYAAYVCRGRGRITGATEGSVTGAKVYPCALRVTDGCMRVHAPTPVPLTPVLTFPLPLPPLPHHPSALCIEYTSAYRLFSVSRDRSWCTILDWWCVFERRSDIDGISLRSILDVRKKSGDCDNYDERCTRAERRFARRGKMTRS